MRRNHQRLKPVNYSICPKCSQAKLPHAACTKCGYVNSSITLKVGKEESS
jgi:large subunit ribosomal protein L32